MSDLLASYPGARLQPLAGDASTRSFFRLHLPDGSTRVVMDYGAPFQGEPDDVILSRVFLAASLPVARVLEVRAEAGCLVLEDLGDLTLERALAEAGPSRGEGLHHRAVLLAAAIADRGTPALARSPRSGGPALDVQRFQFEMDFFLEHYAGGLLGLPAPEELRHELHALAARAADGPRTVLCHRDYHCRNLMVRPSGELAMVDIQDARWGPDSYDLASIVRDAYVDIDEERARSMIATFLAARAAPGDDRAFEERLQVVAAQRMIKALGTFGYQATVRGRRGYLDSVPRLLHRLGRSLPGAPATERLARLMEKAGLLPSG
jgi:aminoglycoside/choline kinase family phosphotransferase